MAIVTTQKARGGLDDPNNLAGGAALSGTGSISDPNRVSGTAQTSADPELDSGGNAWSNNDQPAPLPMPSVTSNTSASAAPAYGQPSLDASQITQAYQAAFGRPPSASELASEQENANKYGAQGILNSISARTNNAPNSGQSGTATWNAPIPVPSLSRAASAAAPQSMPAWAQGPSAFIASMMNPNPTNPLPPMASAIPGPTTQTAAPGAPGAPAPGQPSLNANQVTQAYLQAFGRPPTAVELASELENANKYGAQGILDSIMSRTNDAPGSGTGGSARWTGAIPPASGSGGSGNLSSVTGSPYDYTSQFSDPYTKQLEDTIRAQLNALTNPGANSPQQMLTDFLTQQFQRLSQSQGYTPDQMAMLRTQAIDPINTQRQANDQLILQHASQAGLLPSSGIVQDELAQNARGAGQQTTVAQRNLAINSINVQAQQLQQALGLGTDLNQLDQNTRSQVLQLAQMLYQLPINAQNQAMNVINGTGSPVQLLSSLFGPLQNQQNQQYQNSQNLYGQIGQLLPFLFQ